MSAVCPEAIQNNESQNFISKYRSSLAETNTNFGDTAEIAHNLYQQGESNQPLIPKNATVTKTSRHEFFGKSLEASENLPLVKNIENTELKPPFQPPL